MHAIPDSAFSPVPREKKFFFWLTRGLYSRYVVGSTTVWSGASYIYTKDAVKILSSEERKRRGKP